VFQQKQLLVIELTDQVHKSLFLRATAVPTGTCIGLLLRARISYGNSVRLSVCLSVCHDLTKTTCVRN